MRSKNEIVFYGGKQNDRRTEKADPSAAQIGRSAEPGSGKGTQGTNATAHTGGRDP